MTSRAFGSAHPWEIESRVRALELHAVGEATRLEYRLRRLRRHPGVRRAAPERQGGGTPLRARRRRLAGAGDAGERPGEGAPHRGCRVIHLLAVGSRRIAACGLRRRAPLNLTGAARFATCRRCLHLTSLRAWPTERRRFRARLRTLHQPAPNGGSRP